MTNLGGEVLLLVGTKSVACGQVLQSRVLHGREVPAVASVKEVMDKKSKLQFLSSFDDESDVLLPGMITGWPTRQLQHL